MALEYITNAGVRLRIPGAYADSTVQNSVSSVASSGILVLMGEADAGPDFTLETDLSDNAFGPDALADVIQKYKSGNIVEAFRGAVAAANDPSIVGSFTSAVICKTNPSTKASSTLSKVGGGTYGVLDDESYGELGNLIYYTVEETTEEVVPTTGTFTWINPVGTVAVSLRANGGAALTPSTFTAGYTPTQAQTAFDGEVGIDCTGGALRTVLPNAGTIAITATGNNVVVTYSATWTTTPSIGDTLTIPTASPIDGGAGDDNVGAYVVTGASSNTISATKLSDATKGGAVIGTITPPVTVGAASVTATSNIAVYSPLEISLTAAAVLNGAGKTLEINQLTSGTDLLARCAYDLSTTVVTWVSKVSTPKILISSAESAVTINLNRDVDDVSEDFTAGGQVAFSMGYTGTTCSVTITPTTLTTTVAGGTGGNLSIDLTKVPTILSLVNLIKAQSGYTAAVGTAASGQLSPLVMDEGTFTAGTTFGNKTLRVKLDAVRFFQALQGSVLVQLNVPAEQATAGLPAEVLTVTYLSGGTKAGTTDAIMNDALSALEAVDCNFVIPLMSRDASEDITDGLTDSTSTYTIDAINAAVSSHCNALSKVKRRKRRQGFLSFEGAFEDQKDAALNIANPRCSMSFLDIKNTGSNGIVQFQPWMEAIKAAGMQAAGFYRSIMNKKIDCNGVVHADGSFNQLLDSDVEDALVSGLLPCQKAKGGGFRFVSDQTTYVADNNFVFNSIQAMYVRDLITTTLEENFEKAVVGQSTAEVTASTGKTVLEGVMANLLRLKLIAASDDAPKGYKDDNIRVIGNVMTVSLDVKLANAIAFVAINFTISQVQQSA